MQFTNPKFIWALFAILIPIIIHLFQFIKFRNVYFPNVDLLKELNIEQRKLSNLRRIIIMCLRILAIAALVFVFAGPYIPKKNTISANDANLINIYIDNSPSMEGKKSSITLLDDAKNKAKQIVDYYKENSIYRIFSNQSPINPPILNKNDAITAINNISTSFKTKNMSAIISSFNIQPTISSQLKTTDYYISDLQKTTTDINNLTTIMNHLFIVPLVNDMADNIDISNVFFASPISTISETNKIDISISNESSVDYEKVPVNLHIGDKLITSSSVDINSQTTQTTQMYFTDNTPGIKHGYAEIIDYPITFDNKYFFTYKIKNNIRIVDINDGSPNKYVNTLFTGDSIFYFISTNYKTIRYDELSSFDLIILDNLPTIPGGIANEITKNLKNGKSCLILPNKDIDIQSYNNFLSQMDYGRIEHMTNTEDKNVSFAFNSPFFDGVFTEIPDPNKNNIELPTIHKYYPIWLNTQTLPLVKLTNAKSAILSYSGSNYGNLFVITTLLDNDFSDLQLNALFVPIMFKIAFSGNDINNLNYPPTQTIIPITASFENMDNLKLTFSEDSTFNDYHFENINGKCYVRLGSYAEPMAGNYSIVENSNIIDGFSINNDREESKLDFYYDKDISKIILDNNLQDISLIQASDNNFEKSIASATSNKELWKLFLIFALCFLTTEMILLRKWHEEM